MSSESSAFSPARATLGYQPGLAASGGSAAAVAAGRARWARIPQAPAVASGFCGVVGLNPLWKGIALWADRLRFLAGLPGPLARAISARRACWKRWPARTPGTPPASMRRWIVIMKR